MSSDNSEEMQVPRDVTLESNSSLYEAPRLPKASSDSAHNFKKSSPLATQPLQQVSSSRIIAKSVSDMIPSYLPTIPHFKPSLSNISTATTHLYHNSLYETNPYTPWLDYYNSFFHPNPPLDPIPLPPVHRSNSLFRRYFTQYASMAAKLQAQMLLEDNSSSSADTSRQNTSGIAGKQTPLQRCLKIVPTVYFKMNYNLSHQPFLTDLQHFPYVPDISYALTPIRDNIMSRDDDEARPTAARRKPGNHPQRNKPTNASVDANTSPWGPPQITEPGVLQSVDVTPLLPKPIDSEEKYNPESAYQKECLDILSRHYQKFLDLVDSALRSQISRKLPMFLRTLHVIEDLSSGLGHVIGHIQQLQTNILTEEGDNIVPSLTLLSHAHALKNALSLQHTLHEVATLHTSLSDMFEYSQTFQYHKMVRSLHHVIIPFYQTYHRINGLSSIPYLCMHIVHNVVRDMSHLISLWMASFSPVGRNGSADMIATNSPSPVLPSHIDDILSVVGELYTIIQPRNVDHGLLSDILSNERQPVAFQSIPTQFTQLCSNRITGVDLDSSSIFFFITFMTVFGCGHLFHFEQPPPPRPAEHPPSSRRQDPPTSNSQPIGADGLTTSPSTVGTNSFQTPPSATATATTTSTPQSSSKSSSTSSTLSRWQDKTSFFTMFRPSASASQQTPSPSAQSNTQQKQHQPTTAPQQQQQVVTSVTTRDSSSNPQYQSRQQSTSTSGPSKTKLAHSTTEDIAITDVLKHNNIMYLFPLIEFTFSSDNPYQHLQMVHDFTLFTPFSHATASNTRQGHHAASPPPFSSSTTTASVPFLSGLLPHHTINMQSEHYNFWSMLLTSTITEVISQLLSIIHETFAITNETHLERMAGHDDHTNHGNNESDIYNSIQPDEMIECVYIPNTGKFHLQLLYESLLHWMVPWLSPTFPFPQTYSGVQCLRIITALPFPVYYQFLQLSERIFTTTAIKYQTMLELFRSVGKWASSPPFIQQPGFSDDLSPVPQSSSPSTDTTESIYPQPHYLALQTFDHSFPLVRFQAPVGSASSTITSSAASIQSQRRLLRNISLFPADQLVLDDIHTPLYQFTDDSNGNETHQDKKPRKPQHFDAGTTSTMPQNDAVYKDDFSLKLPTLPSSFPLAAVFTSCFTTLLQVARSNITILSLPKLCDVAQRFFRTYCECPSNMYRLRGNRAKPHAGNDITSSTSNTDKNESNPSTLSLSNHQNDSTLQQFQDLYSSLPLSKPHVQFSAPCICACKHIDACLTEWPKTTADSILPILTGMLDHDDWSAAVQQVSPDLISRAQFLIDRCYNFIEVPDTTVYAQLTQIYNKSPLFLPSTALLNNIDANDAKATLRISTKCQFHNLHRVYGNSSGSSSSLQSPIPSPSRSTTSTLAEELPNGSNSCECGFTFYPARSLLFLACITGIYLHCALTYPPIRHTVSDAISKCYSIYNSRLHQLILGAGLLQIQQTTSSDDNPQKAKPSAANKAVTVRHLSIAESLLSFLLHQLRAHRTIFTHLRLSGLWIIQIENDFIEHKSNIHAKISLIIGVVCKQSLLALLQSRWAAPPPAVSTTATTADHHGKPQPPTEPDDQHHSVELAIYPKDLRSDAVDDTLTDTEFDLKYPIEPSMQSLIKQTTSLHQTVSTYLCHQDIHKIFHEISSLYTGLFFKYLFRLDFSQFPIQLHVARQVEYVVKSLRTLFKNPTLCHELASFVDKTYLLRTERQEQRRIIKQQYEQRKSPKAGIPSPTSANIQQDQNPSENHDNTDEPSHGDVTDNHSNNSLLDYYASNDDHSDDEDYDDYDEDEHDDEADDAHEEHEKLSDTVIITAENEHVDSINSKRGADPSTTPVSSVNPVLTANDPNTDHQPTPLQGIDRNDTHNIPVDNNTDENPLETDDKHHDTTSVATETDIISTNGDDHGHDNHDETDSEDLP